MKKVIISFTFIISAIILSAQDSRTSILQDLEGSGTQQQVSQTGILKSSSRLFGEKDDLTTVITIIPAGSEVEITGADSAYYQVTWDDLSGYLFKRHVELQAQAPPKLTQSGSSISQEQPTVIKEQEQQVSRFSYLEGKYGSTMAARLLAGKIWKGMNTEMVRDSWGKPQKINRVIAGNTVKEEWIFTSTWLYFENDDLVEWGPVRR